MMVLIAVISVVAGLIVPIPVKHLGIARSRLGRAAEVSLAQRVSAVPPERQRSERRWYHQTGSGRCE
jgi:hypothetical protein